MTKIDSQSSLKYRLIPSKEVAGLPRPPDRFVLDPWLTRGRRVTSLFSDDIVFRRWRTAATTTAPSSPFYPDARAVGTRRYIFVVVVVVVVRQVSPLVFGGNGLKNRPIGRCLRRPDVPDWLIAGVDDDVTSVPRLLHFRTDLKGITGKQNRKYR